MRSSRYNPRGPAQLTTTQAPAGPVLAFLATGWNTSHGGVNAFNYDLCRAVARTVRARVWCVVTAATAAEVADGNTKAVRVINLGLPQNTDHLGADRAQLILNTIGSAELAQIGWWVGHDLVTGEAALQCRQASDVGRVLVVQHAAYQSFEVYKHGDGRAAIAKDEAQTALLAAADVVAAVGPKLAGYARAKVASAEPVGVVVELVPGLPDIEPREAPENFRVITFGRVGGSADVIKQTRLAVAAFAHAVRLHGPTIGHDPNMTVIGLASQEYDEVATDLASIAYRHAGRVIPINALDYSTDRNRVLGLVAGHSASLMLSLHEGFGLTGWEAIGAGVPLVVTENSGLYELIDEHLGGRGTGCLFPIDVKGSPDPDEVVAEDLAAVAGALGEIAFDVGKARRDARYLRSELRKLFNWNRAAGALAAACNLPTVATPIRVGLAGGFPDRELMGKMAVDGDPSRDQLCAREVWYAAGNRIAKRFAEIRSPGVDLRFSGVDGGTFSGTVVRHYASAVRSNANVTTYTFQEFDSDQTAQRRLVEEFPDYFRESNMDNATPYMVWLGDVIVGPSIEHRRELLVDGSQLVLCVAGSTAVGHLIELAIRQSIPILAICAFGGETARRRDEIKVHNARLPIPADLKAALITVADAPLQEDKLLKAIDAVVDCIKAHFGDGDD